MTSLKQWCFVMAQPSLKDILSVDELADMLGMSATAIRMMRFRGHGPNYVRVSPRVIRYRRVEVEAWLLARETSKKSPVQPR